MNFVTGEFLLFFAAVLLLVFITQKKPKLVQSILVCAALFFYAYAGAYFLPILLFSAVINWITGCYLAKKEKHAKLVLGIGVSLNLLLLAFFKYSEFFILQIEDLFKLLGLNISLPIVDILFPIGISFYTFQGISYCVESFRQKNAESFLNVLAYLSFFPTILAGPILRPKQFFDQWNNTGQKQEEVSFTDRTPEAFALIMSGLFKKVVIASYLSENLVRDIFQIPEGYSSPALLAAVYGYTVQIYCDFSGYSDMAMGIALLIGFQLPQNFAAPYLALNLQDFWRRWHITLSTWLRDYLYIPLGGNRKGNKHVNLLLTMVLGGLWHGAHLRFIVWGAMHGIGLVAVHSFQAYTKQAGITEFMEQHPLLKKLWQVFAWFLCLHFVALAWVFFRAEDMPRAIGIIKGIALWNQSGQGFALWSLVAIFAGLSLQKFGTFFFQYFVNLQKKLSPVLQGMLLGIILAIIFLLGPDGVLPFIYFQF